MSRQEIVELQAASEMLSAVARSRLQGWCRQSPDVRKCSVEERSTGETSASTGVVVETGRASCIAAVAWGRHRRFLRAGGATHEARLTARLLTVVAVVLVTPDLPPFPFIAKKSKVGFLAVPMIGNNLTVVGSS